MLIAAIDPAAVTFALVHETNVGVIVAAWRVDETDEPLGLAELADGVTLTGQVAVGFPAGARSELEQLVEACRAAGIGRAGA